MLTDCRLLLVLKQMSDCSESMSSNVQNEELLKTLHNLKCKQCKRCNDDMESLAGTIRHTLLEINDIQEKSRERRHREIMTLFENYFTEKERQIPGKSTSVKTEIDHPRRYEDNQVKTNNESVAWAMENSSNIVEETTILELPIAQVAKDKLIAVHKELLDLRHQNIGIQGMATYLESTEATIETLNGDTEAEENDLTTLKDVIEVTKSANTKSETKNKYASVEIKVPSHPIDIAIDEASTEDKFPISRQQEEYRDRRRRKSAEGSYESLYPFLKRSCSTIHRTTNDVSSGTTINVRTKPKEAPNTWSEVGFAKGHQGIEDSDKAGQISVGSRKWLNLDAEDRGGTEITRDEFMVMRNEMFAKQRKKMQDRERKYACK